MRQQSCCCPCREVIMRSSYVSLSLASFIPRLGGVTALVLALLIAPPSQAQNGVPGIRVTPQPVSMAEKAASRPTTRGQHLADTALAYLGCAYKWGGDSPKTGMDCSGLIVAVCRQWSISMPHSVLEQF